MISPFAQSGFAGYRRRFSSDRRLQVQPKDASGQPTDFDADFWYRIFLQGGGITDTNGRTLLCPVQLADISTSQANNDYCERATAFNAIRDVTPPTVAVNGPSSPPAYCASATVRTATVNATASDDFPGGRCRLPARRRHLESRRCQQQPEVHLDRRSILKIRTTPPT